MELDEIIRRITEEVYDKIQASASAVPTQTAAAVQKGSIEYAMLNPTAKIQDIREACETARKGGYASLCIPQWFVAFASETLKGYDIAVTTPVGLPGGLTSTYAKYAEVKEAIKNGAKEVDIPINMEMIKTGKKDSALNDISEAMVPAAGIAKTAAVIEMDGLNEQQLETSLSIALQCGADTICLSSVLSAGRIGLSVVQKAASAIGGKAKLKIFGGINDRRYANELAAAGAAILTTSCNL